MVTEIRPISAEIAWADDGKTAKGATILEAEFRDGEFRKLLPLKPLSASSLAAVKPYADAFAASAFEQISTLTNERSAALQQVIALQSKIEGLTDQSSVIETLHSQLVAVTSERDALQAKLDSMSAHPDVIAGQKQKAVDDAKAKRAAAIAEQLAAESALAQLGEAIPDEVK